MSWVESAKGHCYDFVFAKPMQQFSQHTGYLKWLMIFCILTSLTSMFFCYQMYQNVKGMKQFMVYHRNPAYSPIKNYSPT